MKRRVFVDSEDSEDDLDFVPQTKKSRSNVRDKRKAVGGVEEGKTQTGSNSKRLSRDEKMFTKDLKKALARSTDTSIAEGTISSGSSPSTASQSVDEPTLDDSEYMPGGNNHSDSDSDFEPSPAKKLKKPAEPKKARKAPARKQNVKVAVKSAAAVKCDRASVHRNPSPSAVKGADLPGSSTQPQALAKPSDHPNPGSVGAVKSSDLPGSISSKLPAVAEPIITSNLKPSVGTTDLLGSRSPSKLQAAVKPATTTPAMRKGNSKWVPPAKVSRQVKGTVPAPQGRSSGAAPAIRLGLSRKAPIKPLHSPLN